MLVKSDIAGIIDERFRDAVRKEISNFNDNRANRKELTPQIVEYIPYPRRKFGKILDIGEDALIDGEALRILSDAIPRMATATVKTLLHRRPRPTTIAVDSFPHRSDTRYLFRLTLPQNLMNVPNEGNNAATV